MTQMRHAYTPSCNTPTDTTDWEDMTEQSHKDSVDVNNIIARYQQTGMVDHFSKHGPEYGDFEGLDFHSTLNTIIAVQNMFQDLPAAARAHWNHDPARMVEYLSNFDPADIDSQRELADLGLAHPGKTIEQEMLARAGEIHAPSGRESGQDSDQDGGSEE